VPIEYFVNDGDKNNQENVVIKHNINIKSELKIVNKAIWDFFHSKYAGGPVIIRGNIEEKQRYSTTPKKVVEIFFRKVRFNLIFKSIVHIDLLP
jgi:hypothetical protein